MRTPIKDLRNISKALPVLKTIIPPESTVESFLLFSGDIEINLAEAGYNVIAHTTELSVYDFWLTLIEDSDLVVNYVEHFYPFPNQQVFNAFQKKFNTLKNPYARAALFFLLNRCSETGTVSSGDFDQSRFNPLCLSYLKRFKQNTFNVTFDEDLIESLKKPMAADFVFIPAGKFNYSFFQEGLNTGEESTRFDNRELRDTIGALKTPTLLLQSYHPKLLELYSRFDTKILINKYGKVTTDKNTAKEIIIANF